MPMTTVAAGRATMRTARRLGLRRFPLVTIAVLVVTAAGAVAQALVPGLLASLERAPAALHGQWWRLGTSLFVQDGGLIGTVSNLLFLALVGAMAEQALSRPSWLLHYFVPGVATEFVATAWQPTGAGNSIAICGLAGTLAITLWRGARATRPHPAEPAAAASPSRPHPSGPADADGVRPRRGASVVRPHSGGPADAGGVPSSRVASVVWPHPAMVPVLMLWCGALAGTLSSAIAAPAVVAGVVLAGLARIGRRRGLAVERPAAVVIVLTGAGLALAANVHGAALLIGAALAAVTVLAAARRPRPRPRPPAVAG